MASLIELFIRIYKKTYLYWVSLQLKKSKSDVSSLVIGPDVWHSFKLRYVENLTIGKGCSINGDIYLNAEGGIAFGEFCHVAKGLTVYSSNHNWKNEEYLPYFGRNILRPVTIGDAVWIGANVTIRPGVTIEDASIISIGAVVTKDVPKGAIVAGNPAEIVGQRDIELTDKLIAGNAFC